jgi:phosphate transport system substrate-binding protein
MTGIGNAVPLILGGVCGRSIVPSFPTVKTRDYPLTQPVYLLRLSARQPRVIRDFIAFARAHEAQSVVRAAGFVDQAITRIPFADQGDRLANAVLSAGEDPERLADMRRMIRALATGQRLTLTFRFNDGSSALDPLSLSNVGRLADAIAEGRFDGSEMLFVGFTDGLGDHAGNIRLSQRRADAILAAVHAQAGEAPLVMASQGFGETLPIACDDTNWGRQTNRRVEVWLR